MQGATHPNVEGNALGGGGKLVLLLVRMPHLFPLKDNQQGGNIPKGKTLHFFLITAVLFDNITPLNDTPL